MVRYLKTMMVVLFAITRFYLLLLAREGQSVESAGLSRLAILSKREKEKILWLPISYRRYEIRICNHYLFFLASLDIFTSTNFESYYSEYSASWIYLFEASKISGVFRIEFIEHAFFA